MADSLGGLLQGLNQGVQTGLQLYTAVEGQKRALRQEDFQRERAAREDSQWDSMYQLKKDDAAETRRQYDTTLGENQRQFNDLQTYRNNTLDAQKAYQQGSLRNQAAQVGNDSRRIAIAENTYNDGKLAQQMQRTQAAVAAAMYDENGHLRGTPEEINQRLQSSGLDKDAGKLLAYMAPERYGKGNYSDVRMVVTPKGIVPVVDGHDMEGQPIKAGGAPATVNGSAKDTEISTLPFGNAALALLNPNLIAERQADYLANSQLDKAKADAQQYVATGVRAAKGTDADIAGLSDQMSAAETELGKLKEERAALGSAPKEPKDQSFGDWLTTPNASLGGKGGVPLAEQKRARELDGQIRSLSNALDGEGGLHAQMRSKAQVQPGYEARGSAMLSAKADSIVRTRGTQPGAQYLSNVAALPAAQAKAKEASDKAFNTFTDDAIKLVELPKTKNSKTGKVDMPVTQAHLAAQLAKLPPEVKARVVSDPQAQAALLSTMQTMATNGQSTGLERFVDAAAKVDDLEMYSRFVNDPANVGKTDDERHQWAINSVQQRSLGESPAMSLGRTLLR
jgi:hypothetical protein